MINASGGDRYRSMKHLFCEQTEPFGRLPSGDLKFSMAEKKNATSLRHAPVGTQQATLSVKKDISNS